MWTSVAMNLRSGLNTRPRRVEPERAIRLRTCHHEWASRMLDDGSYSRRYACDAGAAATVRRTSWQADSCVRKHVNDRAMSRTGRESVRRLYLV